MRVMKLDAVEAGRSCAPCGRGKNLRQDLRQLAYVREVRVGHTLAVAHVQGFKLALT